MHADSDENLYREVRQGSETAFASLYAKYEGPLFAFLMRQLQNRQEAEEVFHECMLSLFHGPEAEFYEERFAAWLFKVARHTCLNRHRKKQRESRALRLYQNEDWQPAQERDEGALQHLAAQAHDLDGKLREVYQLRVAGKSYDEISAIIGIPVGTVKSRVFKMVHQLREEMSRWLAQ